MREGRRERAGCRDPSQVRRRHGPFGPERDVGVGPARQLSDARAELLRLVKAALAAVDPSALLNRAIDQFHSQSHQNPTFLEAANIQVVAAGKAAGPMLRAFEARVKVTRSVLSRGGHPLPDEESVRAGEAALAMAAEAREGGGELVVLLSGGASAMLAAPSQGVSLDVKRDITSRLLAAGISIHELNAVRKHLSRIKGGRLAMNVACTTFALSDVTDDEPASIGSGPTVGDPSTREEAGRVLRRAGISAPLSAETPKPGDPALARSRFVLIGNRRTAMDGVVSAALERELSTIVFDEPISGPAAAAGAAFAKRALTAAGRIGGRVVVVASGETTVEVGGRGTGGRNQEFALGAAMEVAQAGSVAQGFSPASQVAQAFRPAITLAAFGTDGVDGNSPAAGAVVDVSTIARARDAGFDPREVLAANDSYALFSRLGDAIVTGPTGTNVGDVFVAIIGA